jgi:hypothetical protein
LKGRDEETVGSVPRRRQKRAAGRVLRQQAWQRRPPARVGSDKSVGLTLSLVREQRANSIDQPATGRSKFGGYVDKPRLQAA